MRGQGGRCKPGFFGVFPTGGSRIVSPLGGGVSLLKGAQVAARTGWAAGVCKKMSLNRYCRPRRTPGWRSRVSFAVILESSKGCVMACLASGKVVFQEANQAQVLGLDAATGQRPQFILKCADGLVCASTHAGCGVTAMLGGARMQQSSVLKIRRRDRATSWQKPVLTVTRHIRLIKSKTLLQHMPLVAAVKSHFYGFGLTVCITCARAQVASMADITFVAQAGLDQRTCGKSAGKSISGKTRCSCPL